MTSLFLGQILAKMAEVAPATRPETTLEPIRPGAWAAWAKAARDASTRSNPALRKPRLEALPNHR